MWIRAVIAAAAVALLGFGTLPDRTASGTADRYEIDGVHSFVLYRIRHMDVGYSYGRFDEISGSVTLDDDPAKCSVEVKVGAASVSSGNAKRDDHLRSPDFFNAAQFPDLTFKSTAVKRVDDTHYEVTGDFQMHGVTKPVTIRMEKGGPIEDYEKKKRVGFDGSVVVQRSQWGVGKVSKPSDDDVLLTIAVEARK